MPKVSQRAKLVLTSEQVQQLAQLAHSRTAPQRDVQRARMLCHYQEGRTFTEIAALVHTTRRLVYECVDRALAMGTQAALRDRPQGSQTQWPSGTGPGWQGYRAADFGRAGTPAAQNSLLSRTAGPGL